MTNPEQPENNEAKLNYEVRSWQGENVLHVYPYTFNESRPLRDDGIYSKLAIAGLKWIDKQIARSRGDRKSRVGSLAYKAKKLLGSSIEVGEDINLPTRHLGEFVLDKVTLLEQSLMGSNEQKHIGKGSILGISEKLDWMAETGVTAIWLGPIYASPGMDGNYDISDYRQINPDLGTMADVEQLIAKAHERNIRVIFDLVPNHTSDQHEWFKKSSNPLDPEYNKYKDYYIWLDPIKGEMPPYTVGEDRLDGLPDGYTVPNNWTSIFSTPQIEKFFDDPENIQLIEENGGVIPEDLEIPAVTSWVWCEEREQFYLAEFMKQQPSLNWQNSVVRKEMKDVIRFWLDKGVDGFRTDVVNHIGKDPEFNNEEKAEVGFEDGQYNKGISNTHDRLQQRNQVSHHPELEEYVRDLLSVLDEDKYLYRNIRFIFEDWMSALNNDPRLDEIQPDRATVFNFKQLLATDRNRWRANKFRKLIDEYYTRMSKLEGAVPNQVTGNHDTNMVSERLDSERAARTAMFINGLLPGMWYVFQREMLGGRNVTVPEDRMQDGKIGGRDGSRVPVAHDSSYNGGYSYAHRDEHWLPTQEYAEILENNLSKQRQDPRSNYNMVKNLMYFRSEDPALKSTNNIRLLNTSNDGVLAFERQDPTEPQRQVVVVANFTAETIEVSVLDSKMPSGRLVMTSLDGRPSGNDIVELSSTGRIVIPPDGAFMIDTAT